MSKFILIKNNNSKKLIIGLSILFCTVILIVGGTLAFFTSSDTKNLDDVATSNVTLDYKDNTSYMRNNIIPVVESDVTKFASKNTLNNYTDEDICHYKDDMYACSLYEFTITNTANVSQNIIVSMTPIINEYNNFYFILYESKVNELNNELNKIETNTKIEQDTINFDNVNIILKPEESKTYTIVFYIKSLDIPQDDLNKNFTASILVNSITTGYKKVVQLGEGCYDFETIEDNTLKLTKFNGINHETGEVTEACGVTKDEDNLYSVTVPSTYAGVEVSTLGNALFSAVNTLEDGTITGINQFINIEKVTIKEGITTIEDGFLDKENMKIKGTFFGIGGDLSTQSPNPERTLKVILPNSLKYIGDVAFVLTAIRELEIPSSVENIGNFAFNSDANLINLTFEENSKLKIIETYAFGGTNITSLIIPSNVTLIGEGAFILNGNLTTLIFEEGSKLTSIGNSAFFSNNISSLTIPASVTSIGDFSFEDNLNLTTLTFEENSQLTTIGERAFYNCNLTYKEESCPLIIPSSVNSIGNYAFLASSDRVNDLPYNFNLKYIKFTGTLKEDNPTGWYINANTTLITID